MKLYQLKCKQNDLNRIIQILVVLLLNFDNKAVIGQVVVQFPLTFAVGSTVLSDTKSVQMPQYHSFKKVAPYLNAGFGVSLKFKDRFMLMAQGSIVQQTMGISASFPDTKVKFNYKANYNYSSLDVDAGVKLFQNLKPFYQVWLLLGTKIGSGSFTFFSYSSRIVTNYNYYYFDDTVLGKGQSATFLSASILLDSELKKNGMLQYGFTFNLAMQQSPVLSMLQDNVATSTFSGNMNSVSVFMTFPLVSLIRSDGWKRVKDHAAFMR